jgi:hypothetical protein
MDIGGGGAPILERAALNLTQVMRSRILLSHRFLQKTGSHFSARCSSVILGLTRDPEPQAAPLVTLDSSFHRNDVRKKSASPMNLDPA